MNRDNVRSLHGAAPPVPQVNDDVVAKLKELLALAESGQIAGLIYGTVAPQGHIGTGWEGNAAAHPTLAAAALLKHRLMMAATEP